MLFVASASPRRMPYLCIESEESDTVRLYSGPQSQEKKAYDFAYDFGFTISVRRPKSYEKRGFLRHDFRNSIYDFSTILVLAFGRSSGTMVAASVGWPPIGRRRDTTLLIPIINLIYGSYDPYKPLGVV